VHALEALIRWQHPRLGLMQAGSFLPLAQNSPLILPISAWTLETACRHLAGLKKTAEQTVRVAVNVSATQFFNDDFVSTVAESLERTGTEPHWLELEFPESVLTQDLEAARRTLERLKELGIGLSADDFGSTFTSLDYVQRLPLDSLKLHPSLIRGVGSEQRPLLIQSIITLAQGSGMRAVAEGVETVQELNLIRSAGCDAAQGYLLAMPTPVEELLALSAPLSLPL
jgi:EAL domain-containing protein (putative c-di-GMP-specific phosphodiesterase class I)